MPDVCFLNQIPNTIVNLAIEELPVVCIQHQLDFVTSFHLNCIDAFSNIKALPIALDAVVGTLVADIFGFVTLGSLARTAGGHPAAAVAAIQVATQQHTVVASARNFSPLRVDFLSLFYNLNSPLEGLIIDDLQFGQMRRCHIFGNQIPKVLPIGQHAVNRYA